MTEYPQPPEGGFQNPFGDISPLELAVVKNAIKKDILNSNDRNLRSIRPLIQLMTNNMIFKMNELMLDAESIDKKTSIVLDFMHGITQETKFQVYILEAGRRNIDRQVLYAGMYQLGQIVFRKLMVYKHSDKYPYFSDEE